MKLHIRDLIQLFNKNSYMIEDHMYQLKYLLKHDILDYKQYVNYSNKGYTRNKVYKNNLFEIYIMCWKPGQQSIRHKHPINGCLMKVLEGSLIEERYGVHKSLLHTYKKNDITFIKGNEEHIINNRSKTKNLITLHIYSPPNTY